MSEHPEDKKPDISHLPRGAISIKGLPVSRNARLPSIRIPRDLTLGAQPKRTFKPNIPVRREKRPAEQKKESDPPPEASTPSPHKGRTTPSKNERGRGRGRGARELIQMEGGLFEQGIAAIAKDRNKDSSFSRSGYSITRASLGKKMKASSQSAEMNSSDMDLLLRDDFIDDGSDEEEDLKSTGPVMFPIQEKMKVEPDSKIVKKEKFDKDFNDANFAKDLGFDVRKISKFIKKEKTDKEATVKSTKEDLLNLPKNDVTDLFKNDEQLFLIKFPHCFTTQERQPRAESTPSTEKATNTSISQLPEGRLGKIQILKSGKARLVVGSLHFQMDYVKHLPTKHEVVSIDTEAGNISVLANVKHLLNVSPDIVGSLTSLDLDS